MQRGPRPHRLHATPASCLIQMAPKPWPFGQRAAIAVPFGPRGASTMGQSHFSRFLRYSMSTESTSKPAFPVTDEVRHALAVTKRGVDELLIEEEFTQKLARSAATGTPLRIKLGLDPTAPDIHIGHTVVLNKMRQLQDLGHTVIFLIGDFTSLIGNPSGRNATRPPLTREQIESNAKTYCEQAALVLDREKTEIRYNSEWSMPLGADGMIKLASRYTVPRILASKDFTQRFQGGGPSC